MLLVLRTIQKEIMSDLSASSSGSGKSSSVTNLFQRECKAAYLMVKVDTANDLLSVEELIQAMQHAGRNPTRRIIRKYWRPDTGRYSKVKDCAFMELYFRSNLLSTFLRNSKGATGNDGRRIKKSV